MNQLTFLDVEMAIGYNQNTNKGIFKIIGNGQVELDCYNIYNITMDTFFKNISYIYDDDKIYYI